MKKYLSLLMIVATIALGFTSCKDKEPENPLVNTTWAVSDNFTADQVMQMLASESGMSVAELQAQGITCTALTMEESFSFAANGAGNYNFTFTGKIFYNGSVMQDFSEDNETTSFTYTYTAPNGTISMGGQTFNFVINGNTMTLEGYTYTKK